jgi:hypothetical protein
MGEKPINASLKGDVSCNFTTKYMLFCQLIGKILRCDMESEQTWKI